MQWRWIELRPKRAHPPQSSPTITSHPQTKQQSRRSPNAALSPQTAARNPIGFRRTPPVGLPRHTREPLSLGCVPPQRIGGGVGRLLKASELGAGHTVGPFGSLENLVQCSMSSQICSSCCSASSRPYRRFVLPVTAGTAASSGARAARWTASPSTTDRGPQASKAWISASISSMCARPLGMRGKSLGGCAPPARREARRATKRVKVHHPGKPMRLSHAVPRV